MSNEHDQEEVCPPHPMDANKSPGRSDLKSDHSAFVDYEVNGAKQRSEKGLLTMEEILRRAGAAAGIDIKELDNYYLDRFRDDQKFRNLSDMVKIEKDDKFLAVYSGRTPVA